MNLLQDKNYCDNIHGKSSLMLYPSDFRLETLELCTCTCTYMWLNNTEQETTLTFSLHDARHLRHLRRLWRQRTSRFRKGCSSTTTCQWSLSHQVFLTAQMFFNHAFCLWRLLHVCIGFRCLFREEIYVQQKTDGVMSQTLGGLREGPIFTPREIWKNIMYTC